MKPMNTSSHSTGAPAPATVDVRSQVYNPSISVDGVSLRDLRGLIEVLWSASDLINAAIGGGAGPKAKCLDDFQALLAGFCISVCDEVAKVRPTELRDATEWSWIMATVGLRCAEGPVYLTGPGLHSDYVFEGEGK
jgi:hypothetical protein